MGKSLEQPIVLRDIHHLFAMVGSLSVARTVTSSTNAAVKRLVKLASSRRFRKATGTCVVPGATLVSELLLHAGGGSSGAAPAHSLPQLRNATTSTPTSSPTHYNTEYTQPRNKHADKHNNTAPLTLHADMIYLCQPNVRGKFSQGSQWQPRRASEGLGDSLRTLSIFSAPRWR